MTIGTYTRFELLRTLRNRRFLIFALGFPIVLYFLIATPNRDEQDIGGSGLSAPLYFMISLISFGAMTGMLAMGGRIADERSAGWNRQRSSWPAGLHRTSPSWTCDASSLPQLMRVSNTPLHGVMWGSSPEK